MSAVGSIERYMEHEGPRRTIMTSWHENTSCITGFLWGEFLTMNSEFPAQASVMRSFDVSLLLERTIYKTYSWVAGDFDTFTLMCHHCNGELWIKIRISRWCFARNDIFDFAKNASYVIWTAHILKVATAAALTPVWY